MLRSMYGMSAFLGKQIGVWGVISSSLFDPSSIAYFEEIANVGGTITAGEKLAANNYILRLKDPAGGAPWNEMVEIWEKLCADPVAATVKLKHSQTSPAVITLHNLTGSDFALHALKGNGVNGYASTGFDPATELPSFTNQSYGVFMLGDATTATWSGIGMGAGANTYFAYQGADLFAGLAIGDTIALEGYHVFTPNSDNTAAKYYHPLGGSTSAGALNTFPSEPLELLRYNGGNWCTQRVGGYFAGKKLTATQAATIIEAREYLMGDVNEEARLNGGMGNRIVFFGDSVTDGSLATGADKKYTFLVAAGLSMTEVERGISSTRLIGLLPTSGQGSILSRCAQEAPTIICEQFGINDTIAIEFGIVGYSVPEFLAQSSAYAVRAMRACKLTADKVVIATQSGTNGAGATYDGIAPNMAQAARDAATAQGCVLVDVYAASQGVPGFHTGGDGYHPGDAGMQIIADTYLAVL